MIYWTLFKYGIPFIIGGLLFGGAAWKYQGARLDSCQTKQQVCADANAENTKTITALQAEIAKGNQICQERLASKDRAINSMRTIDGMKGKKDEKGQVASDDPILNSLNGMFVK